MLKFNVISYTEYVCPFCGRKNISEVKENNGKSYCSFKHSLTEMKKKYKTEVVNEEIHRNNT